MKPPPEEETELIPLEGKSPEEIAHAYSRVVNESKKKPKFIYSNHLEEFTRMTPQYVNLKKIGNRSFAEIDWCIVYPDDEDEEE